MRSRTVAATAAIATLWSFAAIAQQPSNTIKREQSRLVLDMPGLQGGRELYQYLGWTSNYSKEVYYGAQMALTANYPRAQVYLEILAPGYLWTVTRDVNPGRIKAFAPFFKDRNLTVTEPLSGGTNSTHRVARFTVDSADCIYFTAAESFMVGGAAGSTSTASSPHTGITGIYCSAQGAKLGDSDIAAVRAGYRVVVPGTNADRTAATPTTPQSQTTASASSTGPSGTVIPFAAYWDGVARLLSGTVHISREDQSKGEIKLALPEGKGNCSGTWRASGSGTSNVGLWTLMCDSGLSASGTFKPNGTNKGTGQGFDHEGRRIEVTYGS